MTKPKEIEPLDIGFGEAVRKVARSGGKRPAPSGSQVQSVPKEKDLIQNLRAENIHRMLSTFPKTSAIKDRDSKRLSDGVEGFVVGSDDEMLNESE